MLQIETDESGQVGKVTFALAEIAAEQHVSVVGDFNEWDPLANPLEHDDSGRYSVILELPVGASYHFKYLADDGTWFCDPDVAECELNEYGELNSLLQLP
jgi:1,4-alpha-glucan branching enzyme